MHRYRTSCIYDVINRCRIHLNDIEWPYSIIKSWRTNTIYEMDWWASSSMAIYGYIIMAYLVIFAAVIYTSKYWLEHHHHELSLKRKLGIAWQKTWKVWNTTRSESSGISKFEGVIIKGAWYIYIYNTIEHAWTDKTGDIYIYHGIWFFINNRICCQPDAALGIQLGVTLEAIHSISAHCWLAQKGDATWISNDATKTWHTHTQSHTISHIHQDFAMPLQNLDMERKGIWR